jgi:hypothetical protein
MTSTNIKKKLKKILIKFLLISIVIFGSVLWVCSWTYSEGTRSGNLIKVSHKGVLFKTFEGDLNLGGVTMIEGLEGNIWSFTILDDKLISRIKEYEGKRVKVFYKERYKIMPWQGDTNYIAVNIEELAP